MPGPKDPADGPITVSQLAARIDHAIKGGLPDRFTVVGEISSLAHRTHYYFSLKDEQAVISAVVFASSAARMGYTPRHGDSVIAKGRIEYYAPAGRISLIVTSMTPVGEGELERRYKQLCEELRQLGWFDQDLKKPLPTFPRRIAVITSKDGAAVQDVIDTLKRRCPAIELMIVDVRVQGPQAKGQIASAISKLNAARDRLGIEALLITRGGGSMEDLWAFNEPEVARAIRDSHLPVVAAIGHETDLTIAELVADERCATPTQAAMRLSPDRQALREQVASLIGRLDRTVRGELRYEQQRLENITASRSMSDPRHVIAIHRDRLQSRVARMTGALRHATGARRARLDTLTIRLTRHQPSAVHARREENLSQLTARLGRVMRRSIAARREDLTALSRELHAIGPAQVLARGFSVTTAPDGTILRSTADARPGQPIVTTLADGKVRSVVEGGDDQSVDPRLRARTKAPGRRSGRSKPPDPGQPGLFG
ncbi:MAG: exodeoxyribonuclease VII large subunit [Phycisphaerales bacterium]